MDNIFVRNESRMFYDEFINAVKNRMPDRTIVPREDVEGLISKEYKFQLTKFSAQEKTGEMGRVLNGTQILSGRIGKLRNEIRVTVYLCTYPELNWLPGGNTVSVANTEELFKRIPELVQSMQNIIAAGGTVQPIPEGPAGSLYDQLVNATGTVTITVTQNAELPQATVISRASSIILRGDTAIRTILGTGSINNSTSYIRIERRVTLTLENITLRGVSITVNEGGTLIMNNGSTITGCNDRGVDVMGTFTLNEGNITNNRWGGVRVFGGTFTMNGGVIANNESPVDGGGVDVAAGTFTMRAGRIENNTARDGGGVSVSGGNSNFYMYGGTIAVNRSRRGGGVCIPLFGGTFRMTGGTVYGSNGGSNANIAGGYYTLTGKPTGNAVYNDKLFISEKNRTINSYP